MAQNTIDETTEFFDAHFDERNNIAKVMIQFMSEQSISIVNKALCSLISKQSSYHPTYILLQYVQHAFHYTIMFPNQFNVITPDFGSPIYLTTGTFYDELYDNAWKRRRVAIMLWWE